MCLTYPALPCRAMDCSVPAGLFWLRHPSIDLHAAETRRDRQGLKSLRENSAADESYFALAQKIGCPILRAFCEGWDKQKLRGWAWGEEPWHPTLRRKREGWDTRSFVAGQEIRAVEFYTQSAADPPTHSRLRL